MTPGDTIAAFATAIAPAARIVLRTSGPRAIEIATSLCDAVPASAGRVTLAFADLQCPAWAYVFHAPRSYTGDDSVEYHLPGSPVLAQLLYDALLARGARPADPGEFTARAYFAGKLDLTEAEGVAATIAAADAAELAAARQLLAGELARRLRPITDALADTLALVEVGIDFADEDVSVLNAAEVRRRIETVDAALAELAGDGGRSAPLSHEPTVVLAGRPNAGKSSLLNALAGHARAVVSPVAGTTRDVLAAPLELPRGRVQLIDVAGVDEPATDPIGVAMQSHAAAAMAAADVLVLVRDATDDRPDVALPRPADVRVVNKVDLRDGPGVSSVTGVGLAELRATLDAAAFGRGTTGGRLALNGRHRAAVADARSALATAVAHADVPELAAADLRAALDAAGSVVGAVTPDDVLGRIFGGFCIGK